MSQRCLPLLKARVIHGGEYAIGKRKERRPFATRKPMHLVLKSSMATGNCSLLRKENSSFVNRLVGKLAKECGIRVMEFSNNGNHLHFVIRARALIGYRRFIRVLSGLIARHVTGAKKGVRQGRGFWDFLPFSRIVEWGKALREVRNYVIQNRLEAMGVVPYHPRNTRVPWNLPLPSG